MATLRIVEPKRRRVVAVPHKIFLNKQLVCIKQGNDIVVTLPPCKVEVMVQSMLPFIESSAVVEVQEGRDNYVLFCDRERYWDILFGIDMVLWVVRFFLSLSPTANLVYHIFSDGFFVLWGIRTWCIRKRYFHITSDFNLPPER